MIQSQQLLGGLSSAQFLKEYWQKKPLLIRGALPAFADPLSPEELAGLACEDGVEARLVLERGGASRWEVRHGPFTDHDFLTLAETHWALLVQDVEKQAPDLYELLEPFRFIPDWRIEDLMISYAPAYGSVGPHWDDYDVFLLQGMGRRRWQISSNFRKEDNYLAGTELRILREFTPEQEWTLESGDLLYLPPRIAHHGVALEPCMTYSIGFRAPSYQDLIGGFMDFLIEDVDPGARYTDPDLEPAGNPGEIGAGTLAKVKDLIRQYLISDDSIVESWFGRYITEAEPPFIAQPEKDPLTAKDLQQHLAGGGNLERNPGSRFAYVDHGRGETALFVDGQEFILGPGIAFLAPLLCQHRVLTQTLLQSALKQAAARELLLDFVNEGYLVIYEDE